MQILFYILLGLLILILVVLGAYLIIGHMLYHASLSRNSKYKIKIENNHHKNFSNKHDEYFNSGFKKISILSKDKLKLFGFYKDNNKNKIALLVHGYGGSHYDMIDYAKLFEEKEYDILAIDLRAHGASEGDYVSMGQLEQEDLKLWIENILSIKPNYKIVLFGVSLGASTICLTLGQKISNQVVLAIEDCGFANAEKQVSLVFAKTKMKGKFFFNLYKSYINRTKNIDLKKLDICISLKKSKIPVMFIHGDNDSFVSTENVYKMSECLPENRRYLYIAKDAGHIKSYYTNPIQYKKELYNFLNMYNM